MAAKKPGCRSLRSAGVVGIAALAVTVAAWSLTPGVISRAAAKTRVNPLAFNGWRMLVAALATFPFALLLEGFPYTTPWLDPVFEAGVWLGGVAASIFGDGLFVYSVSVVGASIALPVSYLFLVWTGLYDYSRGVAGPGVLLGAALALGGIAAIASSEPAREAPVSRGEKAKALLAALATSFIWGGSMYAYQAALSRAGFLSVAEARALFMVAVLLPLMTRWREWRLVATEIAVSGLLGYVIGAAAFLETLKLMPASAVAVGIAATPVLTQASSSRLAGEKLGSRLLLGGLLVAAGFAIAYYSR